MLRRFLHSLVNTALCEQHTPLLVTFHAERRGTAVEWRLWEEAEADAAAKGWYKHTTQVYPPQRWEVLAGLIGPGEQAPLAMVSAVYQHIGQRSYVAELGQGVPYRYQPFAPGLREALLANGWQELPDDARRSKESQPGLASDFFS